MKQLELLCKTIAEPHFTTVRERLASCNMPLGITAVLHGPPGTGKTESVKQVACSTGRDIMEVDISETKSFERRFLFKIKRASKNSVFQGLRLS